MNAITCLRAKKDRLPKREELIPSTQLGINRHKEGRIDFVLLIEDEPLDVRDLDFFQLPKSQVFDLIERPFVREVQDRFPLLQRGVV